MPKNTFRTRWVYLLCSVVLLALAACGGGGGTAGASFNGSRGGDTGPYTVGGTVSGLPTGGTFHLVKNGSDALDITANGSFTFVAGIATGATYFVAVQSHTPGIACAVSNGGGTAGSASVTNVAVTCTAGTASVLYAFDGSSGSVDGQGPKSRLVADSEGNLYGTTEGGGANGQGTIFKIAPDGVRTIVYSFANNADGASPQSGLVLDDAGNLYGTAYSDGVTGFGTVFKVQTDGTGFTVLHTFAAGLDGSGPTGPVVLDGAGYLYGTTFYGGDPNCTSGCGTIYKVSTQGTNYQVLYRFFGGSVGGQNPQGGLVWDGAGTLFGTTSSGGSIATQGTVFKISTDGLDYLILHSFNGTDGQAPLAEVLLDGAGYLYGTTSAGGSANFGTVFRIALADSSFTSMHAFSTADGQTPQSTLVLDSAGNLYGTTYYGGTSSACASGCGTVFKIASTGSFAFTVLYSFDGSVGQYPAAGLVIDSSGNLLGTVYSATGVGGVFKID